MTTGNQSARGDACETKRAAGRVRAAAVLHRQVERILRRRAKGHTPARIATELKLSEWCVRTTIRTARLREDPRALTEKEAVIVASLAPLPSAPVEAPPVVSQVAAVLRHRIGPGVRGPRVETLRRNAARVVEVQPNAAAGLLHLSDLFDHCPTYYPTVNVAPGSATLQSTRLRFPPVVSGSGYSSPADACCSG